jgi:hypothetical protein
MGGDHHTGLCGLKLGNRKITSVWYVMHAQVHPKNTAHFVNKEQTFFSVEDLHVLLLKTFSIEEVVEVYVRVVVIVV